MVDHDDQLRAEAHAEKRTRGPSQAVQVQLRAVAALDARFRKLGYELPRAAIVRLVASANPEQIRTSGAAYAVARGCLAIDSDLQEKADAGDRTAQRELAGRAARGARAVADAAAALDKADRRAREAEPKRRPGRPKKRPPIEAILEQQQESFEAGQVSALESYLVSDYRDYLSGVSVFPWDPITNNLLVSPPGHPRRKHRSSSQ